MAVRHKALRFGLLEAGLVASLCATAFVVWRSDASARDVIAREERGLSFLRGVLAAEQAFRAAGKRDEDGDGKPEFGTLADLAAARLVEGPVERDEHGPFVPTAGYRVRVLLPSDLSGTRAVRWARPGAPVDPALSATTVAVVALPRGGGPRVLRAFYLDAAGYGFASDGVYSAERDPTLAPPLRELRDGTRDDGGHEGGAGWRAFEAPPGVWFEKPGK